MARKRLDIPLGYKGREEAWQEWVAKVDADKDTEAFDLAVKYAVKFFDMVEEKREELREIAREEPKVQIRTGNPLEGS